MSGCVSVYTSVCSEEGVGNIFHQSFKIFKTCMFCSVYSTHRFTYTEMSYFNCFVNSETNNSDFILRGKVHMYFTEED